MKFVKELLSFSVLEICNRKPFEYVVKLKSYDNCLLFTLD